MECVICAHKMKVFGKKDNYIIYKCSNCGFGLTSGTKLQSGNYHRDETYSEEEKLFKNIFNKRVKIITKVIKKPGSVLEIGCSTGILLSLLKNKGWDVNGVEVSKPAAEIAESRGIPVVTEPFERIKFDKKFDLVILNHTLEHLGNPTEIVKKIKSILSPKGYIYIDLPNFGGISAKVLKTKWPLLLPDEHLWHFSEKSMRQFLSKDFNVLLTNKSSGIWDYGNPYKGLGTSLIGGKKRFFRELATAIPSFVVSKQGRGSDLMVIARKK